MTRDEKINAGLKFLLNIGLQANRYKSPKIKEFWIRLQTLINDKIDDIPETTENISDDEIKKIFEPKT